MLMDHKEITYQCPACSATIDVASEFVDQTLRCPKCEMPFKASAPTARPIDTPVDKDGESHGEYQIREMSENEMVIEQTHPALFRRNPILFSLLAIFVAFATYFVVVNLLAGAYTFATWWGFGLGAVSLYIGYRVIGVLMTTLTVTNKRTTLRKGIIARSTTEVQHDDIRNLQVDQNMLERILGVGDVAISSSGQDDLEIDVDAIPHPDKIADTIRRLQ